MSVKEPILGHPEEMEKPVQEFSFLDRLANELAGSVCSVFGPAVERGGVTVIPVAKARWGMGGSSARQKRDGEVTPQMGVGAGGGAIVKPMGFIEVTEGRSRFRPIVDPGLVALTAIATGAIGVSALRTIGDIGRSRRVARTRFTRRRLGRALRRMFR
jgi:uncharacterized spore protein YtfJ